MNLALSGVALCPACEPQVSSGRSLETDGGGGVLLHTCLVLRGPDRGASGHVPIRGPVSEPGRARAWVKDFDFSGVTPLSLLLIHSCVPWLCVDACLCVGGQRYRGGGPSAPFLGGRLLLSVRQLAFLGWYPGLVGR